MFDNLGNVQTFLIVFPAHGTSSICRYEERKAKKQDTAENELQIESLCLTNGGNHCFNKARGGGDTPIHYLYRHVLPNGVVILKLLI